MIGRLSDDSFQGAQLSIPVRYCLFLKDMHVHPQNAQKRVDAKYDLLSQCE